MTARRLFYAGWAVGVLGLLLTVIEGWLGAVMVPAGLLLLGAARADLAGEVMAPGSRFFFNLVLAFVGIGWIAFGVAVALD